MSKFSTREVAPHRDGSRKEAVARPSLVKHSAQAVAFLSGAVVLLLEILGARILAPHLGASFAVWVNVIGTILGSLSLGYYLGGVLADRNQKLLPLILLLGACAVALVHFERPLLPEFGDLGLEWGSLLAAILLFAPASAVLGMVSPYLLKISASDPARIGRISGGIFAASTLGSIAGTFLGGFYLIPHFTVSSILGGMVVLLLILSAWTAATIRPSWLAVSAGLVIAIAVQALGTPEGEWSAYVRHVFEKNSLYYNIRINDGVGVSKFRLLLLDGKVQSGRLLDQPGMFFPYVELSAKILQKVKPSPQSVLVIGGGGYTIPEFVKTYAPTAEVTVVEIDPEVTAAAKQFFLQDPGIQITTLNEDGRVFLNRNRRQFDVLYTDAYVGLSIPPFLATREAFQQVRRALKPDGIAVFNIASARAGKLGAVYEALFTTIREVFPQTAVFSTNPAEPNEPHSIIVIGTGGQPLPEDGLHSFESSRVRDLPARGLLLTDDFSPTDYLGLELARQSYEKERAFQ
ncbi:MAG: fused MFS/spermidine synthase [Candidatus Sulfotelmatobacter sp.]